MERQLADRWRPLITEDLRLRKKYLTWFSGLFWPMWLICAVTTSGFSELYFPDFMVSMTRHGKDARLWAKVEDCHSTQNLDIFRIAYARSVLLATQTRKISRIPKIIHQIWLGSPVPNKYSAWMQTWMRWIGWEYKLWTDNEIQSLLLYNQELYNRSRSYGEKTDILRLEILLDYGGIYVDTDFECLNPNIFEELGNIFDFYIGFEPIEHGTMNGIPKICNAIIGAAPRHPIIKKLIANMKSNWILHEFETGIQKAGPDYFSRTLLEYEKHLLAIPGKLSDTYDHRHIYLPCTFFYPISDPDLQSSRSQDELLLKIVPETAAVHYWSGSWRPQAK